MRAWQLQPVYMCSCLMIIWFSFQVSSTYTVLHLRIHSVKYDTKVLYCGRAQKFYIYSHPSVGGGGLRSSDPHIRYETIRSDTMWGERATAEANIQNTLAFKNLQVQIHALYCIILPMYCLLYVSLHSRLKSQATEHLCQVGLVR